MARHLGNTRREANASVVAEVIWTARALRNLRAIRAYVAKERPITAAKLAARLTAAGQGLDIQPERGRAIGGGRRELTHVRPYVIRYRVKGNGVEILEIRHAARKPE